MSVIVLHMQLGGCASAPKTLQFNMPVKADADQLHVWPKRPEIPRYLYLGDITGESNIDSEGKVAGNLLSRFFSALVGLDQAEEDGIMLQRPQSGMVDDGKIYVTDVGQQAVFVFDEQEGIFSIWDETTRGVPFKSPIGIVAAKGKILVTDSEQGNIFVFNKSGEYLGVMGGAVLKRPTGITYDHISERIFVVDTQEDNIKVFNLAGDLVKIIGSKGDRAGEFNRPTYISYKNNKLYVVDTLNARVQIFSDLGDMIQGIGERGLYIGNFTRPKGIASDSEENIYVVESYYDHLLIYNSKGDFLLAIGGSGQGEGKFSLPAGIWIDNNDRIFIADMLNARVSVFQYLGD